MLGGVDPVRSVYCRDVGTFLMFWRNILPPSSGSMSVRWQCSPVTHVGLNQEREGMHGLSLSPLLLIWGENTTALAAFILILKMEMQCSQKTVILMFNDCKLNVVYIALIQCKLKSNTYTPRRQYQSTCCLTTRLKFLPVMLTVFVYYSVQNFFKILTFSVVL